MVKKYKILGDTYDKVDNYFMNNTNEDLTIAWFMFWLVLTGFGGYKTFKIFEYIKNRRTYEII